MVPLFPCAPALSERCTVVDTVPKRSSTALYSPIRARDQKCLLGVSAREETACSTCEPPVTGKSVGRVYRLIDLVSSSSIDDTLSVFAESVFLERSFSTAGPPSASIRRCDPYPYLQYSDPACTLTLSSQEGAIPSCTEHPQ